MTAGGRVAPGSSRFDLCPVVSNPDDARTPPDGHCEPGCRRDGGRRLVKMRAAPLGMGLSRTERATASPRAGTCRQRDCLVSQCAIRRLTGKPNVRSRASTNHWEPGRSLSVRSASRSLPSPPSRTFGFPMMPCNRTFGFPMMLRDQTFPALRIIQGFPALLSLRPWVPALCGSHARSSPATIPSVKPYATRGVQESRQQPHTATLPSRAGPTRCGKLDIQVACDHCGKYGVVWLVAPCWHCSR